jgi:predicted RNA-binding protein with PUA-like domain
MACWLLKTEPSTYAFEDLRREGTTAWSGVKNALARRHLGAMASGDDVVVYHSGEKAAVGLGSVVRAAYPEPGGGAGAVCVDVRAGRRLAAPVALSSLQATAAFRGSPLLTQGRLSVVPLSAAQWRALLALERKAAPKRR